MRIWCPGGATWPAAEGQDFIDDHASPDIDFATIHSWVDNWKVRSWHAMSGGLRSNSKTGAILHDSYDGLAS